MATQTHHGYQLQSNKHDYTRLYQVVLRRRACHFCVISYAIGVVVLWFVMLDIPPALGNGLRITTWAMGALDWASATIPLMTLRRVQLTVSSICESNRYRKFWTVLKSSQFITSTIFCTVSGLLLGFTYLLAALALNENPGLSPFKTIPGRGAPQINERPLYLLASCWYTASCYSFFAVYDGKWHYRPIDSVDYPTIPQRIGKSFASRIEFIRKLVIYCSTTFLPIYLVSRRYIIRAIVFSKYTYLTKPIKAHMVMLIKFDSVFTLSCTIRLLMLNLLMMTMWEVVQVLWDVYSTHPLDLSRFDTEPNQCLLEGLKSSDPRVQHHAIRELAHISWSDPERRATIFQDIRTSPRLLNLIIEETLKLIDATKSMIELRGQVILNKPVHSLSTPSGPRQQSLGAHSALKNDLPQLFESPSSSSNSLKQVLLTKFLSSDQDKPSFSSAQPAPAGSLSAEKPSDYQIPAIFKGNQARQVASSTATGLPAPDTQTVQTSPSNQTGSTPPGQKREKIVPRSWKIVLNNQLFRSLDLGPRLETWLFSPLIIDELEKSLPRRQLCIFAVEAVTNLTCASLTEDQYGVLQDQIPRIMESLVDCFNALGQLRADICIEFDIKDLPSPNDSSSDASPPDPQQVNLHQALDEFLHPLLTRLKVGIIGITDQFKPYLKEMSLNPKINQWIQSHPR